MTYPSIHAIWARWAPPLERSRLAAVAFSGKGLFMNDVTQVVSSRRRYPFFDTMSCSLKISFRVTGVGGQFRVTFA